jgi:phosphoglycolate phosphatase
VTDSTMFAGATIVFDLDGTLVESAPDLIAAVNATLATEGFGPIAYEQGRPLISRGARALLQFGLEAADEPQSAATAAALFGYFIEYYSRHIADETRPFPGVVNALEVLKAAGATLVVCTNKPTELSRSLLDKLDLTRFFGGVMGIDAVTAAKPDPAHLIEAVKGVGGDLARTVMVGDADTDAGAARAAGTPLILVDFGYSDVPASELGPDILLHHFDDLVKACGTLLRQR